MANGTPQGRRIEVEIFSTGDWNGETFTRADLEEIAGNFERLKAHLKPPLKFGHDENQTLLGQSDGDPALGWVEGLRVFGDKLLATFAGVPEIVFHAIRAGRYRRVSAEIYFNVRRAGKRLGKALKAVALLGADLPAVTNLEDLTAFLTERPIQQFQVGDSRVFAWEVDHAEPKSRNLENAHMEQPNHTENPEAELAELRAYKAGEERRRDEEAARRKAQAFHSIRETARVFCEEQVQRGALPPHFRRRLMGEVEKQAQFFAEGAELKVSFEWVREFVAQCPPVLPQGEVAYAGERGLTADEDGDPSVTLARLASARMVEMNLTYGQAADYVLKSNPALAEAYRDYTLNPTKGD